MTETILAISVVINIILLLYIRWFLKSYAILVKDIEAINDMIINFTVHVKSIYELEMFYGDQTLSSLMEHGKQILDRLQDLDLLEEDYDNNNETEAEKATQEN